MRPTYSSRGIRVWRVELGQARTRDEQSAALLGYFVNGTFPVAGMAPGEEEMLHWFALSVIHLRDIPGARPAYKMYPEAEHELMVASLDPRDVDEHRFDGDLDLDGLFAGRWSYRTLTPLDVQWQWHGSTDKQAVALGEQAISAVLSGLLTPNAPAYEPGRTAFQLNWYAILGKTLEHERTGHWPAAPEGQA